MTYEHPLDDHISFVNAKIETRVSAQTLQVLHFFSCVESVYVFFFHKFSWICVCNFMAQSTPVHVMVPFSICAIEFALCTPISIYIYLL